MKKIKIVLRPQSPGKKFYLFPTSDSLNAWLGAMERGEHTQVPDIEELVLEQNGFIEAELRGFEYTYERDQKFRRLDLVRLGKAQQPKNSSGLLVTIHTGWVAGGLLPMKPYVDADIAARLISDEESRIDLPTLFKDDERDD